MVRTPRSAHITMRKLNIQSRIDLKLNAPRKIYDAARKNPTDGKYSQCSATKAFIGLIFKTGSKDRINQRKPNKTALWRLRISHSTMPNAMRNIEEIINLGSGRETTVSSTKSERSICNPAGNKSILK